VIVQRAGGALIALALGAALAGCATPTAGVPQASPATAAAPAPTAAPGDAEAEIRAVFDKYTKALLDRDFATACAIMTEDAAAPIASAIARNGGPSGLTCVQAFEAIYRNPQAAAGLDDASRGIRIESIEVTGDTATVTYGGAVAGNPVTGIKATLTRIDGTWRVEGTS
jgi:ketosteroid isomerase-like protein